MAKYQLASSGSIFGQPHFRNIQKSSQAAGAGSAIGVVSLGLSDQVTLQHAEDNSNTSLETISGSTLSVIPLQSGSTSLSFGTVSVSSPVGAYSSSTYGSVTVTSSFAVPSVHDGTSEIFIMTSFDVTASQQGQGSWKLQVKQTSSSEWLDVGNPAHRTISMSEGIVTIAALADVASAGTYEVRLVQASDGTANLTTSNIDLVAVSLAIDETSYLQSYQADSIGATSTTLSLSPTQDTQVFVAANITANSTQNATGTYQLSLQDGTTPTMFSTSTREVDSDGVLSLGSVALSGIVDVLEADTNSIVMDVTTPSKLGFSGNSNLVAFELTAVPEPAGIGLVLAALALFWTVASHKRR